MKAPRRMGKIPATGHMAQGDFGSIRQTLHTALALAIEGDRYTAMKALGAMYGKWCDAAELEIEANIGEPQAVHGIRGRSPVFKWAPLIDGSKKSAITVSEDLTKQLGKIAGIRDLMLNLNASITQTLDDSVLDCDVLNDFQLIRSSAVGSVALPGQTSWIEGDDEKSDNGS